MTFLLTFGRPTVSCQESWAFRYPSKLLWILSDIAAMNYGGLRSELKHSGEGITYIATCLHQSERLTHCDNPTSQTPVAMSRNSIISLPAAWGVIFILIACNCCSTAMVRPASWLYEARVQSMCCKETAWFAGGVLQTSRALPFEHLWQDCVVPPNVHVFECPEFSEARLWYAVNTCVHDHLLTCSQGWGGSSASASASATASSSSGGGGYYRPRPCTGFNCRGRSYVGQHTRLWSYSWIAMKIGEHVC